MISAQFDLTWTVEYNPVIVADGLFAQAFFEPIEIRFEVFHTVQHSTVRTEVELIHSLPDSHELE